ncbi:MAG: hypothetical protein OEY49_13220 [Candidatus Heimdallarchaeota archaeon]|nr:hypothetical protein [Candidatus Heimdallarchaeota archaeon]
MEIEIRSELLKIEDLIKEGNINNAINQGIISVKTFDKRKNLENSISILNKLVEISEHEDLLMEREKFITHIIVRYALLGDNVKVIAYKNRLNQDISQYANFIKYLVEQRLKDLDVEFHLDKIETQNIFGKFEPIHNIPYLSFENDDELFKIINDYYEDGRYQINLIQSKTSLHHQVIIDKGNIKDMKVVENQRTFILE